MTRLTVMFLNPTAVHWLADEHDTALRLRPCAPDGRRIRCDAHFRPFQRSAALLPIAMHAVADVHETALREYPPGTAWLCHLVPFQCSTSGPPE